METFDIYLIIYLVFAFISIWSNLISVIYITARRHHDKIVRAYIVALSLSDLTFLTCDFYIILSYLYFKLYVNESTFVFKINTFMICKAISLFQNAANLSSANLQVLYAYDRHMAISRPIRHRNLRVCVFLTLIFCISLFLGSSLELVDYVKNDPNRTRTDLQCFAYTPYFHEDNLAILLAYTGLDCMLPLLLVWLFNLATIRTIKKNRDEQQQKATSSSSCSSALTSSSTAAATTMAENQLLRRHGSSDVRSKVAIKSLKYILLTFFLFNSLTNLLIASSSILTKFELFESLKKKAFQEHLVILYSVPCLFPNYLISKLIGLSQRWRKRKIVPKALKPSERIFFRFLVVYFSAFFLFVSFHLVTYLVSLFVFMVSKLLGNSLLGGIENNMNSL